MFKGCTWEFGLPTNQKPHSFMTPGILAEPSERAIARRIRGGAGAGRRDLRSKLELVKRLACGHWHKPLENLRERNPTSRGGQLWVFCIRAVIYIYIYKYIRIWYAASPPPPPNGHGSDKYPPCGCGPVVGLWWFRVGLELV